MNLVDDGTLNMGGDLNLAAWSQNFRIHTDYSLEQVGAPSEVTLRDARECGSAGPEQLHDYLVRGGLPLKVDNATFVLDGDNSNKVELQPFALFAAGDDSVPLTFTIDSSMLEGVQIDGSMTLDLSRWAEEIRDGGYENVALSFADSMAFTEGSTVSATLNGTGAAQADFVMDNMAQFSVSALNADAAAPRSDSTDALWRNCHTLWLPEDEKLCYSVSTPIDVPMEGRAPAWPSGRVKKQRGGA